jgi:hypothetical protein
VGSGVAFLLFVQILASLRADPVVHVARSSGGALLNTQVRAAFSADSEGILYHIRVVSVVVAVKITMTGRSALLLCQGITILNARGRVLVAMGTGAAFFRIHASAAFDASTAHGNTCSSAHSINSARSHTTNVQMGVAMRRSAAA